MNQLEKWSADGVIALLTAEVAQEEMLAGNDAARTAKAYQFIFTMSEITSPIEKKTLERIEQILFPGGAVNQNQRNDVEIVFNSAKYLRPLITTDGGSKTQPVGILGNKHDLAALGVTVLRPEDAEAEVRHDIELRDESAIKMAALTGQAAPKWVRRD
jgi:hypothetical protein